MKNKFILTSFLSFCMLASTTLAQQTGSFNEEIDFGGTLRRVSFFVPNNYDPNVPSKLMVALHGMGDFSPNYRNALVQLGFENAFPNTILICPDGGNDQSRDFYAPIGDEAIIETAIQYTVNNYNIDTNTIVLQGFSLGGRSALRYGLTYPEKFKMLLLNTPAIQGVKEAQAEFGNGGIYDYTKATELPIYINYGATDDLYINPIQLVYENIVKNNGQVRLYPIANMGHNITPFNNMLHLSTFMNTPALFDHDLSLTKINVDDRSCDGNVPIQILVQNKGKEVIQDAEIQYRVSSANNYTQTVTLNLQPFQHTLLSLDDLSGLSDEDYTLKIEIAKLNGGQVNDDNLADNNLSATFRVEQTPRSLPFIEKFEDYDFVKNFVTKPSGDYILPWEFDDEFEGIFSLNSIFIFDNSGTREGIESPVLDLSSLPNPIVRFDVAYSHTEYTASVFGIDTVFADTLEVLISTDCGETFESIYKKGGEDLLTFDQPIINPLDLNAFFFEVRDEDWRKEEIDLSNYANAENAIIKFNYISALGGVIYLDNIFFGNEETNVEKIEKNASVEIFPNPAKEKISISTNEFNIYCVVIYDLVGREIMRVQNQTKSQEMELIISGLSSGLYLMDIITENGLFKEKISISK